MKKKAKRVFLILAMLCALSACTSAVEEDRSQAVRAGTKVAVHDSNKQDVGSIGLATGNRDLRRDRYSATLIKQSGQWKAVHAHTSPLRITVPQ